MYYYYGLKIWNYLSYITLGHGYFFNMDSIITLDAGQSDSRQETVQPVNTNKNIYLTSLIILYALLNKFT